MPARAEAKERQALKLAEILEALVAAAYVAWQAAKLAEIREALVAAGYNTTPKQAAVLGLSRSTAGWLLNHDKRAGPSAKVIKRILLSPQIPKRVRRKVEQYVEEKVRGIYGHSEQRTRWFSEQFHHSPNS
jgi:hypothetical protein